MTIVSGQGNILDRPARSLHRAPLTRRTDHIADGFEAAANVAQLARREQIFAAIRVSRALQDADVDIVGAVVSFPTVVVSATGIHDLTVSHVPGLFAYGVHAVTATVEVGSLRIDGSFAVVVGAHGDAAAAQWTATDITTKFGAPVPAEIAAQLPASLVLPAVCGAGLVGMIRRTHLAAERARHELLEMNRGLVRSVVNRFRGVVRSEASSLDLNDLMIVGEHQLLQVVDRWYADPQRSPERAVAWSKLVQRAIGNAIRSEIARATGISVEFRQLLSWFHAHPEDRREPATVVAQRIAFGAAVTRLLAKRGLHDRAAGVAALELMLLSGEAAYVAPARGAQVEVNRLRAAGVFVISSRSSIAEIERAQNFGGAAVLTLDTEDDAHERDGRLGATDGAFDDADTVDIVRRVIEDSGMTKLEALVWLHRSGALDPGGYGTELPDIAEDLGLDGRGEARAALRRARRKLDAWAVDGRLTLVG
ncbi:MAG TPA: hypothetical protein VGM78_00035 [Ilumatobacteraceae bacterium]|jgi:hypothetical protein